jgi:hypothetical protein
MTLFAKEVVVLIVIPAMTVHALAVVLDIISVVANAVLVPHALRVLIVLVLAALPLMLSAQDVVQIVLLVTHTDVLHAHHPTIT